MNPEVIDQAAHGGSIYIWAVMFAVLVVIVGYLAYINKDTPR